MTDTCRHGRSRLLTPLAVLVGALVISGGSAYAAAQITSAQIKDGTIRSVDVKNNALTGADVKDGSLGSADLQDRGVTGRDVAAETLTGAQVKNGSLGSADLQDRGVTGQDVAAETLTGAQVKNGSLGAADLQPGVANRLVSVSTRVSASNNLAATNGWQWALSTTAAPVHQVTSPQLFTVTGMVGYGSSSAVDMDVAVCVSADGSTPVYAGSSYGTVRVLGRVNVPVQGEFLASAGTSVRIGPCVRAAGAATLSTDVSSISTMITSP